MKGGRTLMIENAGKEKKGRCTLMTEKVGKEKKEDEGWVYIRDTAGGEREKA